MRVCGNQTLLVAVQNLSVFQFVKIGHKLSAVKGRDFEILKALSSKLNFQYELVTPDDGQFGNCDDKGHCKGMIGMVARQEADMAISHVAYTQSRAKYIDFSYPYFQEDITFATKNIDGYQEVNSKVFVTQPMDRQVWIFFGSLLLIFISVIKLLEYFKLLKTKMMSVQTMLQILLRQSVNLDRNEVNVVVIVALLTIVVTTGCVCKFYECTLASATSLAPVTPPIDTISDMVEAIRTRNYAIGTLIGTSNYRRIMTSRVDYLKIFAASILKNVFVDSGLIDKWQREDSTLFNQSTTRKRNVNQNYIGLSDLKLIFAILICGCLIGFVSLLIERLLHKRSQMVQRLKEKQL